MDNRDGKVFATAWLKSLQTEENLRKETFYKRKWRAENELKNGGYEGYFYHVNHPEKLTRLTDKVNWVSPREPIKIRPADLGDTEVENAVQRKFAIDRLRRRIRSQHLSPKAKFTNPSHSNGGITSNQEYGWYGSMGGHVRHSGLFHSPIIKSKVTEYVGDYHLTWGINPFKIKSSTDKDIAK